MRINSTIFKNPQDDHLFDLSYLGIVTHSQKSVTIEQENHYFQVADVLYYDIKNKKFSKAIAKNTIESEVCGVVSKVIDLDNFEILTDGEIETDRYSFDKDTPLYLSNAVSGRLVSIEPDDIIKQVAVQSVGGIIVNIQRGYRTADVQDSSEELEPYTQDELDEIIKNIW